MSVTQKNNRKKYIKITKDQVIVTLVEEDNNFQTSLDVDNSDELVKKFVEINRDLYV